MDLMVRTAGWCLSVALSLVACGSSRAKSASEEAAPLTRVMKARLRELLPFCHAGSIDACGQLGSELLVAGYEGEASSAWAFACFAPSSTLLASECKAHLDGKCASCNCPNDPTCVPDVLTCGDPDGRDLICGDGDYKRCVQREQLLACTLAATRFSSAVAARWAGDEPCTDDDLSNLQEALTFADQVCRAEVDALVDKRFRHYDNGGDDRCKLRARVAADVQRCAGQRRAAVPSDADVASVRARLRGELANAVIDGPLVVKPVPEPLLGVARLHPDGERIFQDSGRARERLNAVNGVLRDAAKP